MTFKEYVLNQFNKVSFKTSDDIEIEYLERAIKKSIDIYADCYLYKQICDLLKSSSNNRLKMLIEFLTENYDELLIDYKSKFKGE